MISSALTHFAASASAALVSAVWQGALLALCVALLLRLLPGLSSAARSLVWLATFALALSLHFLSAVGSNSLAATQDSASATSALVPAINLDPRWSLALLSLWAALSLVRAGQLLVSAQHLRRVARDSRPVPVLGRALPRRARVCVSDEVDRPTVAGFARPRILFPPALLAGLAPAELDQILLHETEHLRRGDDWTNLLQKVALVVFPLDPVLLWIERRLCLERELACDDRVLASTGARKAYALCLTGLAERTLAGRGLSLALGAWERQSELARRVLRILAPPARSLSRPAASTATGALVLGLLGATVALSHAPALVGFTAMPAVAVAAVGSPHAAVYAQAGTHGARLENAAFTSRRDQPRFVYAEARVPERPRGVVVRSHRRAAHHVQARARLAQLQDLGHVHPAWDLMLAEGNRLMPLPAAQSLAYPAASAEARSGPRFDSPASPVLAPVHAFAAVPLGNGWLIFQL